ncbi:MAG: asparagine synthase (glutamine-hydrolyzing) [Myxococcaceae bacterium]|nr:asparagine synthase (glutamine-hydrolyzing) [Myxococcaceae bacterium]
MCGIAGVFHRSEALPPPAIETLEAMARSLRHRGPDEFGVYRDGRCGLAHSRLSIVDLSSGQQPLANEDHTLWVSFNGEIFNFIELRRELEALGHTFRTKSDTEVIVHAYEAWGEQAFERFNGQWAVALWDEKTKTLVLTRDRLGVRPLYYAEVQGKVVFGSEVKALFTGAPELSKALDPVGLKETFTFWTVVPPQTVFQGVLELEPGHVRTYRDGTVRDVAYWTHRFPEGTDGQFRGTVQDAADAVRAALLEATSLRMLRADVPVGSYLSGGIDSSLTATLGREAKGDSFLTFSLRFADAEYDETPYQRLMSQQLGTEHHEVLVSRADIAQGFSESIRFTERPIVRSGPVPLYLLSQLVHRTGLKVVLTGEGADEIFAGYDLFREGKVRRFWAKHPGSAFRPRLLERLYPYLQRSPTAQQAITRQFFGRDLAKANEPGFAHGPRWSSGAALQRLFAGQVRDSAAKVDVVDRLLTSLPPEFPRWTHLAQDQYLEMRTLLAGYLLASQGDRMLMGNSVEGRFPFLDKNVVALAGTLPDDFKLHVLDEKHVLKRASRGRLPEEILTRPKQPYRAPDALTFATPTLPAVLEHAMSRESLTSAGVFEADAALKLWSKCRDPNRVGQFSNADNMAVVGLLSTQLVHHHLIATPIDLGPQVPFKTRVDRLAKR